MSIAVEQVLDSFDSLSEQEQQQAAVEVLKRVDKLSPSDIPDESFVEAGAALFQALDEEEADAESESESR